MRQIELIKILMEDPIYKDKYLVKDYDSRIKEIMDKLIKEMTILHSNKPNAQQSTIANDLNNLLNSLLTNE